MKLLPASIMTQQDDVIKHDPWELVWGQPYINADRLSQAIEQELAYNLRPDFRTRLLIRDSTLALQSFWGNAKFTHWLAHSPARTKIQDIIKEDLGEPGFHQIRSRLVTAPQKAQLEQIFELLGRKIQHQSDVYIAGSIPTLIEGLTARPTDDIDLVDEVPPEIRQESGTLDEIASKYGLIFGHVPSHYLPLNWKERCRFLGDFGRLRVYLVDEYDIFVSKLSSKQEKHQDDLRVMAGKLDKEKLRQRLLSDGKRFLESQFDRPVIQDNWRFIFRESLSLSE